MGSVFTAAVGIAGWSVGFIKDIHFRGMRVSIIIMSVYLCCSCHYRYVMKRIRVKDLL